MKIHDVQAALDEVRRNAGANPRGRANASLGKLNNYSVGLGRYTGRSPWERHLNGDELLYVLDGEVEITMLTDDDLITEQEILRTGCLFVVPQGRWHQLNAITDGISVFSASPPEDGAERTADDPRRAKG
jgi:mannose-6-phosphate isomerase-like protein (cupin superfamily)